MSFIGKSLALDVDGVLMECYPPINARIVEKFDVPSDFRIQRIARSWNLTELPEDIRLYALALMAEADIVEQYTFKKGSKKFVKELYDCVTNNGGQFIFNTHCLNEEVGKVRRKQLETLSKYLGIEPIYNISVGPTKVNAESDIIIDDHKGNLDVSPATTKILFSMFHNRNLKAEDAFRSNDYNEIVRIVREVVANA